MTKEKINSFSDYRFFINKDLKSQGGGHFMKKFVTSPIYRFTVLLRFNEYLINTKKNLFIRLLPLLWYKRLSVKLSFSIPFNVFSYGPGIVHYGLLIVNPKARIGKNCRIHAGVNIGASAGFLNFGDTSSYAPKIGDNCYIGPGSKIFGPISIGNNCVIGANAVVNKSFKRDNITIGGIPAKIISENGSEGLLYNI